MSKNNTAPSNKSTAFSWLNWHFTSKKIKTKDFPQASTEAISLIEKFGKVFLLVTYDITNNIKKLNQKYEEDVVANKYLEEMIHTEQRQEGVVTDALLWLRRFFLNRLSFSLAMSKNNPAPSTAFSLLTSHFSSQDIKTKDFLQASTEAVSLIEKFGKVFSPVIYDMTNNIKKLNQKYEEDTEANKYLEKMILREQRQGEGVATDALLWLRRALHFLSIFYESIIEDTTNEHRSNDLTQFMKKAYSATLEQHHGWLGTQLFNVLSRFTPTRRQLLFTLALEKYQEENVIKDMQKYNQELRSCVESIITFYD